MSKSLQSLFNLWIPSPLQKMDMAFHEGRELYFKRDDLIHHHISGNKYRKLKYNFIEFQKGDFEEIVSFGGAFSNLLYTLSFIGKKARIPMTFYIRGDGPDPENPTLKILKKNGANIQWLSRSEFRELRKSNDLRQFLEISPRSFIIPEGGSNEMAVPGGAEVIQEIREQLGEDPDHIIMDLGTGGTFAGVLSALPKNTRLTGIPVIKGVDWKSTIGELLDTTSPDWTTKNMEIIEDYHFGGFAKYSKELIDFINQFKLESGIPLDPIYTGKLVFALTDLLSKNYFDEGQSIVCIHGGGHQGIAGYNYLHGHKFNLDPL